VTHWDSRFLGLATLVSTWSKDQSSKVGACIVGPNREIRSVGYNGMCRGVDDEVPERHERPLKYKWFEHAERNAIYNAVSHGTSVSGCVIYVTHPPCCDCARGIIQSGIISAFWFQPSADMLERWANDFRITRTMFREAGVRFVEVSR